MKITSPSKLSTKALTIFLLVLAALAPIAFAQEEPVVQEQEEALPDGAALLEAIKARDTELLSTSEQIENAEGEELVILRTLASELTSQQMSDLAAALDLLQRSRKTGSGVVYLEQQIEPLLSRMSRHLRGYIGELSETLQVKAAQRAELTADEAGEFEHRMAVDTDRLDHLYLGLITLTLEMEAAGYPVDDEREFLEERLPERGEHLLKIVEVTRKRLDETKVALRQAPEDQDLQARHFAREERYDFNKAALVATIHMMRLLGLDHVDLEVRTVELTGEVTPEALEVAVATGLLQREWQRVETYLIENGPRMLVRFLVIATLLVAFWILAKIVRVIVRKVLQRVDITSSQLLREMLVSLSGRLVLLIGLVLVLSQLGIDLGPILAGLGIIGLVIGFALQDSLSNFAAGAMILAYRPFDVGDLVETAGVLGKVDDMNLVSTRILTPDNQRLTVPNGKIWGDVIRNMTAEPQRRVDLVFGIAYEDEIPKAERLLAEIVSAHEKVLTDPKPLIKLHNLNDSSVDFIVRPWVHTKDYWEVYWDLTREVKMRFDAEGVSIPYPQRDVHLIGAEPGSVEGA